MKSTPENRKAVDAIIDTVRIKDTGYQIYVNEYDGYFYISLRQPKDTDKVAYPEIFCKDNWFGDKALGFEIATTGYGDHSITDTAGQAVPVEGFQIRKPSPGATGS